MTDVLQIKACCLTDEGQCVLAHHPPAPSFEHVVTWGGVADILQMEMDMDEDVKPDQPPPPPPPPPPVPEPSAAAAAEDGAKASGGKEDKASGKSAAGSKGGEKEAERDKEREREGSVRREDKEKDKEKEKERRKPKYVTDQMLLLAFRCVVACGGATCVAGAPA